MIISIHVCLSKMEATSLFVVAFLDFIQQRKVFYEKIYFAMIAIEPMANSPKEFSTKRMYPYISIQIMAVTERKIPKGVDLSLVSDMMRIIIRQIFVLSYIQSDDCRADVKHNVLDLQALVNCFLQSKHKCWRTFFLKFFEEEYIGVSRRFCIERTYVRENLQFFSQEQRKKTTLFFIEDLKLKKF